MILEIIWVVFKWIGKEDFNKIPIVITAFGDIFFYDRTNGTISFLDIHYRQIELCTDTWQEFFDKFLVNEKIRLAVLKENLFNEALKKIGKLSDNEMYMFVPALIIGGTETTENMKKGDASTHQHLLFDFGTDKINIEVDDITNDNITKIYEMVHELIDNYKKDNQESFYIEISTREYDYSIGISNYNTNDKYTFEWDFNYKTKLLNPTLEDVKQIYNFS